MDSATFWRNRHRELQNGHEDAGPTGVPNLEILQSNLWTIYDQNRQLQEARQARGEQVPPDSLRVVQERYRAVEQLIKDLLATGNYWQALCKTPAAQAAAAAASASGTTTTGAAAAAAATGPSPRHIATTGMSSLCSLVLIFFCYYWIDQ
jgi:hypothetical protein